MPLLAAMIAALPAQSVSTAAFDSTIYVWSVHTTVRERIDSGPNSRIELWERRWVVSPSGRTYSDTTYYGLHAPDGMSTTGVTLNEAGRWAYWSSDGGAIDDYAYGDAPSAWYMWPMNPPNGYGYGGAGIVLTAYIDVEPSSNRPPTISWNTTPGSVASGQQFTISAHGHDPDGNLIAVDVERNGMPFAYGGGGNGTDADSGNPDSAIGPVTITYTARARDAAGASSGWISQTVTVAAFQPPNTPPSISWNTEPGTVDSGQVYTISAHGYDPDGNLVAVDVDRNGSPFAYGGGGNGTHADSGNPDSATGPASITYTARARDAAGASSGWISQTVTVRASNRPPTISWNTQPGTVSSGESFAISAHGHDPDGNLVAVDVDRNGSPFAYGGGGNGTDADSGNPDSATGPTSITYTARARDAAGASSGRISQTVTVSAPPSVSGSISASPSSGTAPGSTTIAWSTSSATSVSVSGYGLGSSTLNGSRTITGIPAGSYTYTLTAQGYNGPITRTATFNVSSSLAGSLTISPSVINSNETATLNWTTTAAGYRWVHGHSPGMNGVNINPAPASGSTQVSSLSPGSYRFVLEYGPDSYATQTAFADLTVLAVNRTVSASVSPAGAGSVSGAGTYQEGAYATVTASASSSYIFSHWSGSLSSTNNPLTFLIGAQNYSLVANLVLRSFTIATSVVPAGAGSVTGGGTYPTGSTATLTATASPQYRFTGWSGAASGTVNPLSFTVTADAGITAHFEQSVFTLTTSASGGGSVTPGGTYPAGSGVTISADGVSLFRFTGWIGDASGSGNPLLVTMDRDKSVIGLFSGKLAQSIAFSAPANVRLDADSSATLALAASASSGLPVTLSLISGPANLNGGVLTITGAGPVVVTAIQPGDATYLPAPAVNRTINGIAPAFLTQDTRSDKVHTTEAPGNSSLVRSR